MTYADIAIEVWLRHDPQCDRQWLEDELKLKTPGLLGEIPAKEVEGFRHYIEKTYRWSMALTNEVRDAILREYWRRN